jgi:hypothetical protein
MNITFKEGEQRSFGSEGSQAVPVRHSSRCNFEGGNYNMNAGISADVEQELC